MAALHVSKTEKCAVYSSEQHLWGDVAQGNGLGKRLVLQALQNLEQVRYQGYKSPVTSKTKIGTVCHEGCSLDREHLPRLQSKELEGSIWEDTGIWFVCNSYWR